jgi:hypothetical protein
VSVRSTGGVNISHLRLQKNYGWNKFANYSVYVNKPNFYFAHCFLDEWEFDLYVGDLPSVQKKFDTTKDSYCEQ